MTKGGTRKAGQGSKWIRRSTRSRIYSRDAYCCQYCGCHVTPGAGGNATLDHIVPVELGGSNDPSNLVTACLSCNSTKQDRSTSEFVTYLTARGINADGVKKGVRNAARRRLPSAAVGLSQWETTRAAAALVA